MSKVEFLGKMPSPFIRDDGTKVSPKEWETYKYELLEKIVKALPPTRKRVKMLLPFSKGGAAAEIRKTGVIHSEEYVSEGLLLDATVEIYTLEKYKEFILEE